MPPRATNRQVVEEENRGPITVDIEVVVGDWAKAG